MTGSSLDKIFIENLSFFAHHGVFQSEAELGQRFVLSVTAFLDLKKAGETDDWSYTTCYSKLAQLCVKIGTEQRFKLIEALAHTLSHGIFEQFPLIQHLTLKVEKPAAAIPALFETVGIEISRSRHDFFPL
jgi:7,8-dihydroneopterin aldolase/epimerase/oxygenase